jgi:hypothetical protein
MQNPRLRRGRRHVYDDTVMPLARRNMIIGGGNIESFWSRAARIKELARRLSFNCFTP